MKTCSQQLSASSAIRPRINDYRVQCSRENELSVLTGWSARRLTVWCVRTQIPSSPVVLQDFPGLGNSLASEPVCDLFDATLRSDCVKWWNKQRSLPNEASHEATIGDQSPGRLFYRTVPRKFRYPSCPCFITADLERVQRQWGCTSRTRMVSIVTTRPQGPECRAWHMIGGQK